MHWVYIVFSSREDEAAGLVQLARNARVDALTGGVYGVRREDLKWLDAAQLPYRYATEDEIGHATERIRHPLAASIQ